MNIQNDMNNNNDDKEIILATKKDKLLPWAEKYRPQNVSNIIYHDKITKSIICIKNDVHLWLCFSNSSYFHSIEECVFTSWIGNF